MAKYAFPFRPWAPGQFWKGSADHCLTETKRLTSMSSETGKAQLDLIAKFGNGVQSHIQAYRPCLFGNAVAVLLELKILEICLPSKHYITVTCCSVSVRAVEL